MTLQTQKYVLGLVFWHDCVALIFKTGGPEYVRGTWNGIGGKIEEGETPVEAMLREFAEEAGIVIGFDLWHEFAVMEGVGFEINCFTATLPESDDFSDIQNYEDKGEIVEWVNFEYAKKTYNITPNLSWLLPLSRDVTTNRLRIIES